MKYLTNCFLILLICACNPNSDTKKFGGFAGVMRGDKTIIISCVRCNCVIDVLNKIITEEPALLNGYIFAGDTTCTESFLWRHKIVQYTQKQMDSISVDFYNLLVIRKNEKGQATFTRLIKTTEAWELKKYL